MAKKKSKNKKKVSKPSSEANAKLSKKEYEAELFKLHAELVNLQHWIRVKGLKIVVVFEGRDAAGKGGVIKRITERVSPRVFRVEALPAPNEREKTQMYAQRYIRRFPAAGECVLFDRSWYNRAGVERVMKFCTKKEYERFLNYVPIVERWMVDSDIQLIKYWFDISMEEQERRFQARIDDPRKIWKLSPMDIASFQRWYDYSRARDDMLAATNTGWAPWYIVPADNKRRARLNCISHLLSLIPHKKLPREVVKLGKRNLKGRYDDQESISQFGTIPQKY
ncbi:MAG: polyphosphate kinase 2 [Deltaproteobacteria bacterium]|nr:polyphosphate kinase 2 [Deltaproteobacteria bacterium]